MELDSYRGAERSEAQQLTNLVGPADAYGHQRIHPGIRRLGK